MIKPTNNPINEEAPRRPQPRRREPSHLLVFAPMAWMKLMFFLHVGNTEVGGFAISSAEDPLYVQDFFTIAQSVTAISVEFDDQAVADYFDSCVDAGLKPKRFGRIWCHTHPGDSPEPSYTDEHTFDRVFGACQWAVMFIVSRTGRTYARLWFPAGPGGYVLLEVAVDWDAWPRMVLEDQRESAERLMAWVCEYDQNVHPAPPVRLAGDLQQQAHDQQGCWDFEEYDFDDPSGTNRDSLKLPEPTGGGVPA